ncbi:uncharacterized protein METZ01_LOCUS245134, partial [marine metagenome]
GTDSIQISGTWYTAPTTDLDGIRPNPAGTVLDMGAYESEMGVEAGYVGPVWYVDGPAGLPYGNGGPGAPFRTIQTGIGAASDGDTVSVKAGTYIENIDFDGKNIVVIGADRETTIIDGDSSGTVVKIADLDGDAVLKNFTIQNGFISDEVSNFPNGGGVSVNNASPVLKNLKVKNNIAHYGGGIYIYNSTSLLENISVYGNESVSHGAGIYLDYTAATLRNVASYNNSSGSHAGGIFINNDYQENSPTIIGGSFHDNQASYGVGGVFTQNCAPSFYQSNIVNNQGGWNDNENAGGLFLFNADVQLVSCIVSGNSSPQLEFDSTEAQSVESLSINYSLIQNGQDSIVTNDNGTVTWGDGNIDVDPIFVDTANGNYHLLASSQLINAGHPDSLDSDGTRADIGAYPHLNSYSGPTWYISESGNDTTATGASDDPFRSIQAGINFSSDTDSVTVAAGTYV